LPPAQRMTNYEVSPIAPTGRIERGRNTHRRRYTGCSGAFFVSAAQPLSGAAEAIAEPVTPAAAPYLSVPLDLAERTCRKPRSTSRAHSRGGLRRASVRRHARGTGCGQRGRPCRDCASRSERRDPWHRTGPRGATRCRPGSCLAAGWGTITRTARPQSLAGAGSDRSAA
jgi:hypothetical protein